MEKLDEGLKTLLDLGKRRGFLTFDQVNDFLPDEAASPEKIQGLLESLDELGIDLINEDEAEARLLASGDLDDEPEDAVDEPVDDDDGELTPEDLDEISRRIDDPVRMYLTQMGEIPLLTRDQEINLAKKIEITRKRFRRKVLECHFALAPGRRRPEEGQRRRAPVRPDGQGLGDRAPGEGPDPRPDAAQPGHPRPPDGVQQPRLPRVRPRAARPGTPDPHVRAQEPPPQGGQPGRGALDPDPEGPAADEAARAGLGADVGADGPAQGPPRRPRRQGRPRQPAEGAQGPDADHPGDSREPQATRRGDELPLPRVRAGQARALRRQPPAGRLDRQEVSQPRPLVPRPDPGGEHRPDAGRRQVRVPPRLQVQHLCHLVDPPGDHPRHRRPGPDDPHPGAHDRDDVQAAQRLQEAAPGEGPRADDRGDRQGRQHLDRGDPARDEDLAGTRSRSTGRSARARTATSATSSRTRPPRARSTPRPRRCSRRRSTRS